jgi:flagellar basal body rod protein FlgG
MTTDIARMSVIGQNLANVSTTGYRRELPVGVPFVDYLAIGGGQAIPAQQMLLSSVHDFRPGSLQSTGNPLDFAVEGEGFFEVLTDGGSQYTRQGNFRMDSIGRLVTEAGSPVAGESGEILLKSSQIKVDGQGRIVEGEKDIGRIRVTRFSDPQSLVPLGSGMYALGERSSVRTEGFTRLRQGFLEASNVNSTQEMVRMIETMRHFEAGQKVIQAYDDMLGRAFTKLGDF